MILPVTAKYVAHQFTTVIFWEVVNGEVEEEGGIEAGFVVWAVEYKHVISTCDRIGGHRWRVWIGGGKEGVREKRLKEVNKTDGSTVDRTRWW